MDGYGHSGGIAETARTETAEKIDLNYFRTRLSDMYSSLDDLEAMMRKIADFSFGHTAEEKSDIKQPSEDSVVGILHDAERKLRELRIQCNRF